MPKYASWWITITLITLNISLYLWQVSTGVDSASPTVQDAIAWGADYAPLTFSGQPYRLMTNLFFHFGFIHLALNMWALYLLGQVAETIFGHLYFIFLYLMCGILGSLFSDFFALQNTVNAGASGAVMGLAGALTLLAFKNQCFGLSQKNLAFIIGTNLIIGYLTPQINNLAHIGGMLTGAVLGFLWSIKKGT